MTGSPHLQPHRLSFRAGGSKVGYHWKQTKEKGGLADRPKESIQSDLCRNHFECAFSSAWPDCHGNSVIISKDRERCCCPKGKCMS